MDKLVFLGVSAVLGAFCLAASLAFWRVVSGRGASCQRWAREPKWVGLALGLVCLVWSAYHGCGMLEGDLAKFHPLVWALVPVTAALSWYLLDYVNARALGGFLTLCANHLIQASFAFDVPGRAMYGVVCLALGIAGMVGIGLPWRYRDLLRLGATDERWRRGLAVLFGVAGALLLVMPLFARM